MDLDSSVGIATELRAGRSGYRILVWVWQSNQTGPGAYPASCTMDTGSFPGVKRPGLALTTHPHPSRAEIKERVELYLYPTLWVFVVCSRGDLYLLRLKCFIWTAIKGWDLYFCSTPWGLSVSSLQTDSQIHTQATTERMAAFYNNINTDTRGI